jgi:3'-phosphoadenosine 5'-phosphosulfate sulfotransferase (PAPS reductase)/FAD synthetase
MRTPDELLASGLGVIERAYVMGAYRCAPLFSGGHDSLCACHIASQHRSFQGVVHHIDTTIGAQYTREFVQRVCDKFGWRLAIHKSKISYEMIVRKHGFPGPGAHGKVYNFLKERCVREIIRGSKAWRDMTMLINGARAQESVRRMGYVSAVTVGRIDKHGKNVECNRAWTAPCHDWSKAEQMIYMDEHGLPINRLKVQTGMSRECNCGAFAEPGEIETVREHIPDVAAEIGRLEPIAKALGKPCVWGQRPPGKVVVGKTGPMCHGCDRRAARSGIVISR